MARQIDRRSMLKTATAAGAGLWAGGGRADAAEPAADQGDRSLIRRENEKPGALDWQLTRVRIDRKSKSRSPSKSSSIASDPLSVPGTRRLSFSCGS